MTDPTDWRPKLAPDREEALRAALHAFDSEGDARAQADLVRAVRQLLGHVDGQREAHDELTAGRESVPPKIGQVRGGEAWDGERWAKIVPAAGEGSGASEAAGICWRPATSACVSCGGGNTKYRVSESSCGGYEDTQYRCDDCGHARWVDGPDS